MIGNAIQLLYSVHSILCIPEIASIGTVRTPPTVILRRLHVRNFILQAWSGMVGCTEYSTPYQAEYEEKRSVSAIDRLRLMQERRQGCPPLHCATLFLRTCIRPSTFPPVL